MNQILTTGQEVKVETTSVKVEKLLGGGTQGEVYSVHLDGKPMALKWFKQSMATAQQRENLETLVKMGPPTTKFLWPQYMASSPTVPGFGYLMDLRSSNFSSLEDFMAGRVNSNFRALACACRELADNFRILHSRGLCYRDISFGNVFFEAKNGEILICDNDNVGVQGHSVAQVQGTPRFMAPEIVKQIESPSTQTDLFSLAVLLFYILFRHHPLEGKKETEIHCFDLLAMRKLYGDEPLFIFDPKDQSNAPVPGEQENPLIYWKIYPNFLKELFIRAFTEGITDPLHGRIRETEWVAAMIKLADSLVPCIYCRAGNFYDMDALKLNGGKPGVCWKCKKEMHYPFRLRLGRNIIMLNADTKLYPHHLDSHRGFDQSQPVAEVSQNPQNPGIFGLKNLSAQNWILINTSGETRNVEPGRTTILINGYKINFGNIEGEIRY
ncbi:MAG: serine/threonine protein kinase [Chloroflexi bacterium 54-19]|nr:MAG: serine/threonine protein kinase [Chloroflexi bacterium 54-19]